MHRGMNYTVDHSASVVSPRCSSAMASAQRRLRSMVEPFRVTAVKLFGMRGSATSLHPQNKRNLRNLQNYGLKTRHLRFQKFHRYRFPAPRRALRLFVLTVGISEPALIARDLAPA